MQEDTRPQMCVPYWTRTYYSHKCVDCGHTIERGSWALITPATWRGEVKHRCVLCGQTVERMTT